MNMKRISIPTLASVLLLLAAAPSATTRAAAPAFSLAWSEYPSWSVFGVAHVYKLIDGREGKLGPIEEKWGVDIVLKEADYDPCMTMYSSGQCDAVCITDMDVLNPALSRPSVVILPTSTSFGADALIVANTITDIKQLRGKKVYGLQKSVSEYCFVRNLELLGEKESDHLFTNMDPSAAAVAMQQKQEGFDAIVVWNPFVMETLNRRSDVKVLFDSTTIPNEIIDSVAVAQASLDKPRGKEFACAVIDTYYALNERIANPATRDETLVALGEKFSHLDLAAMKKVVQQTKFYATPKEGLAVLTGPELRAIMTKVVDFCVKHEITTRAPKVGYGTKADAKGVNLRFDPTYINLVVARKK
jgi:ABC-type nitrate/sulfonate/bicarbonate transport system substrate-binding protein